MNFKCLFGHQWNGNKCERCGATRTIKVNDFFNAQERNLLIEATHSAGRNGIDVKNHILNNGILNDDIFNLLSCTLDLHLSYSLSMGKAFGREFAELSNKINSRGSN